MVTLTTLTIALVAAVYIGYTIGAIHACVVAQREMKQKNETIELYQTMVANMSTMISAYMEKGNNQ
jgi:hypothetical protein